MTERSDPDAAAESNNQAANITRYTELAQHHERKEDLMRLLHAGFSYFAVNEGLLRKYIDVNIVANMLMGGQVSTEEMQELLGAAGVPDKVD